MPLARYVRGRGPTVLFIQGLGGRAADWGDAFLDLLAPDFEVVTFDNRGTGKSESPGGTWSLEDFADDAVAVLDELDRAHAHVVGLSMGGMIAQLLALRHPARVRTLGLVCTHMGGHGLVPPTAAATTVLMADPTNVPPAEIMRRVMHTITGPGFAERTPAAVDAMIAIAAAQPTPPATFARQLQAIMSNDRSAALRDLRVPTLVVHGVDDPLIPIATGRALAAAIPGARLVELPGVGHLPNWECPGRLADLLRESFR